jgi:hypothetical protein
MSKPSAPHMPSSIASNCSRWYPGGTAATRYQLNLSYCCIELEQRKHQLEQLLLYSQVRKLGAHRRCRSWQSMYLPPLQPHPTCAPPSAIAAASDYVQAVGDMYPTIRTTTQHCNHCWILAGSMHPVRLLHRCRRSRSCMRLESQFLPYWQPASNDEASECTLSAEVVGISHTQAGV